MSKRIKRASVSYNINVDQKCKTNKIDAKTELELDNRSVDALMLNTTDETLQTIEACVLSAEAAARSTAKLATKIARENADNSANEELQKRKSAVIESIAEAAVATATAARIAAKISKISSENLTNGYKIEDLLREDSSEDTEDLIDKYSKPKINNNENNEEILAPVLKKEMNETRKETNCYLNRPSVTRVNTPKLKKHQFYSQDASPSIDSNNIEIESRTDLKNIFDDCFKKIKNTLSILTKNGVDIEFLKNKFNLILDDIILLKSDSEILLHVIKDGFDDIAENIKDGCILSVEFLYDVFEDIINTLTQLTSRNIQISDIKEKIYEILFSLPKKHTIYNIKDKLDNVQETIEDITYQTLNNLGIKRSTTNEDAKNIQPVLPDSSNNVINAVSQNMSEYVSNTVTDIENEIQNMKLNSLTTLESSFEKLKTEAINYIETFKNNAINTILQQSKEMKIQSDNIINLHNDEIELIKKKANSTILEMTTLIKENEQKISKDVTNYMKSLNNRVETVEKIVQKIDTYYDVKLDNFTELLEDAKEELREYSTDVATEIQESKNTIKDEIDDMIEEGINIATQKLMEVYEKGMIFKNEIESSNEKNKLNIIEYVQNFIENCKNKIQEHYNNFVDSIKRDEIQNRNILETEKKSLEETLAMCKVNLDQFGGDLLNSIKQQLNVDFKDKLNEIEIKSKNKLNEIETKSKELQNQFEIKSKDKLNEIDIKSKNKLNEIETKSKEFQNQFETKSKEFQNQFEIKSKDKLNEIETKSKELQNQFETKSKDKLNEIETKSKLILNKTIENGQNQIKTIFDDNLNKIKHNSEEELKEMKNQIQKIFDELFKINLTEFENNLKRITQTESQNITDKISKQIKKEIETIFNEQVEKNIQILNNQTNTNKEILNNSQQLFAVSFKNEIEKTQKELKELSKNKIEQLQEKCLEEIQKEVGDMIHESMDVCDNLYNKINSFSLLLSNYLINENIDKNSILELQELLKAFNVNVVEIRDTVKNNTHVNQGLNRNINRNFRKMNNLIHQQNSK